ncbi:MAG: hypothetical protein A2Z14_14970 [Chloroflexi bacterium RBG_16_48_8]|nr:MAG: hypothetical protein A2Z14_14970 [Chloroflexi bacterium RBG_16_48_8]
MQLYMNRRAVKRVSPALIVGVGFAFIIIGVITYAQKNPPALTREASLPISLAGLSLVNSSYSQTAIAEIVGLHNEKFPLTSGATGVYGVDGEVKLWVTGTTSDLSASSLVLAMRDAISVGDSPFQPINEISHQGRKVYHLTGIGQRHYYFQAGYLEVWLAVEPDLADQVLRKDWSSTHESKTCFPNDVVLLSADCWSWGNLLIPDPHKYSIVLRACVNLSNKSCPHDVVYGPRSRYQK